MHCGIYTPASNGEATNKNLILTLTEKLNAAVRTPNNVSYRLSHISALQTDGRATAETQAHRNKHGLPPFDLVIAAYDVARDDMATTLNIVRDIRDIRLGHPRSTIAVYINLQDSDNNAAIRGSFTFNAISAGAALLFIEPHGRNERNRISRADFVQGRQFRTMLDAVLTQQITQPLYSIEFLPLPTSRIVTLGDITIEKKEDRRARGKWTPAAIVTDTATGQPRADLTGSLAHTLWVLASYKNAPVPTREFMLSQYSALDPEGNVFHNTSEMRDLPDPKIVDINISKLNKIFEKQGSGRIHTLWGTGRVVFDADWKEGAHHIAKEDRPYFFTYSNSRTSLTLNGRSINLAKAEAEILEHLIFQPGQIIPYHHMGDNAVHVAELRDKIDWLGYKDYPDLGRNILENVPGTGYRLLTCSQLQAKMATYAPAPLMTDQAFPGLLALK